MAPVNFTLLVGAGLSVLAGLLHVAIIIGGPAWYRVVHAGARVIDSEVRGSWYAPVITLAIAIVLLVWAAYALSAAGALPPLPLLQVWHRL
jgi:hypothetical protein